MKNGEIFQMAYVVDDLDRAVGHWTRSMPAGPFDVVEAVPYEFILYRGRPIELMTRVAIGYSGDLQIELIQQISPEPSIFTEFRTRGDGPHHVCALSESVAADVAAWQNRGASLLQNGRTKAGIDFAYLDTTAGGHGAVLELVESKPGLLRYFDRLRDKAAAAR
jgi:methylmalonyl-CoA/ethylmalonyl-CoA epimerase